MSFTPAKPVSSSQTVPYRKLPELVTKHLFQHTNKRPIAGHTTEAFSHAYQHWYSCGCPNVILDSACGMAESSRYLAHQHPQDLIIGIDQSKKRLSNHDNRKLPDNCLLLRAECTDFWRLAEKEKWHFTKHYLLYPNPWPKPQHIMRRWHGHPAFSSLLAISAHIELRTNWRIYAEEFTLALQLAQAYTTQCRPYSTNMPITAFERKFIKSEHELWQVYATI